MAGHLHEPIRVNLEKVFNPELAPKGAGLKFFTYPVFWGLPSDRLPFFEGLDLPSTRCPLVLQTGPP